MEYVKPSWKDPAGGYVFNLPAIKLLSLVADVPELLIGYTMIMKRGFGQYIPWYSASGGDCGGGITLGDAKRNWYRIYYTENFFSNTGSCPHGNDIIGWLRISSHEVGIYYKS